MGGGGSGKKRLPPDEDEEECAAAAFEEEEEGEDEDTIPGLLHTEEAVEADIVATAPRPLPGTLLPVPVPVPPSAAPEAGDDDSAAVEDVAKVILTIFFALFPLCDSLYSTSPHITLSDISRLHVFSLGLRYV